MRGGRRAAFLPFLVSCLLPLAASTCYFASRVLFLACCLRPLAFAANESLSVFDGAICDLLLFLLCGVGLQLLADLGEKGMA